jgi:hypothetical protein
MEWSWEAPYKFVGYQDEQGFQKFDEGGRVCVLQDRDEQVWKRPRSNFQVFQVFKQLSAAEAEFVKTQHFKVGNGEIYDGKTWKKWIFRKFCHWSRSFGIFFLELSGCFVVFQF